MDVTTVLREVNSWPAEDRIRLIETVWDQLVSEGVEPDITDAQRAELDRRMAEMEADPGKAIRWEGVEAHLRRSR
jgi:putative addiction module component (TIGR02574 family)